MSGYKNPPKTWEELEIMASVIQRDERERRKQSDDTDSIDFWGFGFQAGSFEGVGDFPLPFL